MKCPADAEALVGMECRIRVVPMVGGKPMQNMARVDNYIVESYSEACVFVHHGYRPKRRGGVFKDSAQLTWGELSEIVPLHPATVLPNGGTEVRQWQR